MTTSDKKPRRRTTKASKTAKTDNGASSAGGVADATGAAIASRHENGSAAAVKAAAGSSKVPEDLVIKPISIAVTARHPEDRHAAIAKAAYFRSESRGFTPGHEVQDWLAAEEEVDQLRGDGLGAAS